MATPFVCPSCQFWGGWWWKLANVKWLSQLVYLCSKPLLWLMLFGAHYVWHKDHHTHAHSHPSIHIPLHQTSLSLILLYFLSRQLSYWLLPRYLYAFSPKAISSTQSRYPGAPLTVLPIRKIFTLLCPSRSLLNTAIKQLFIFSLHNILSQLLCKSSLGLCLLFQLVIRVLPYDCKCELGQGHWCNCGGDTGVWIICSYSLLMASGATGAWFQIYHFPLTTDCCWAYLTSRLGGFNDKNLGQFCSLIYFKCLEWYLAHNKSSTNMYWGDKEQKWMQWGKKEKY